MGSNRRNGAQHHLFPAFPGKCQRKAQIVHVRIGQVTLSRQVGNPAVDLLIDLPQPDLPAISSVDRFPVARGNYETSRKCLETL